MADSEFSMQQRLDFAENLNEIYREQLQYTQDHLASLRSQIQDKEEIIQSLMLQFNVSNIELMDAKMKQIKQQTNNDIDAIIESKLKVEALAQRLIADNSQLREMINELRDENSHLRNEIYTLQDTINLKGLRIRRLKKKLGNETGDILNDEREQELVKLREDHQNQINKLRTEIRTIRRRDYEYLGLQGTRAFIDNIERYLKLPLYQLIPQKLNAEYRWIYQRLFFGYNREFERDNQLFMDIPQTVSQIVSNYYPWFIA